MAVGVMGVVMMVLMVVALVMALAVIPATSEPVHVAVLAVTDAATVTAAVSCSKTNEEPSASLTHQRIINNNIKK